LIIYCGKTKKKTTDFVILWFDCVCISVVVAIKYLNHLVSCQLIKHWNNFWKLKRNIKEDVRDKNFVLNLLTNPPIHFLDLTKDSLVIGVARVGTSKQQVVAGTIEQL
jgi:hypothetical protein